MNSESFHVTLVGANEADMLLLANYLQQNTSSLHADVATTAEAAGRFVEQSKSRALIIVEDATLDLSIEHVVQSLSAKSLHNVEVVALLPQVTHEKRLALSELGVHRLVNREDEDYYGLVQSIVLGSLEDLLNEKKEGSSQRLTLNAWIGLVAILVIVILSIILLVY